MPHPDRDHSSTTPTFTLDRLHAYQVAVELLELVQPLLPKLPRSKGRVGDQLERASESVLLRICEAVGLEQGSREQRRHFRAARGSALECVGALEACRIRRVVSPEVHLEGRRLLHRLVGMLTRLSGVS